MTLAEVAYDQPLFWAVVIGWVLTVTLHEFAHGLAGYLGGDFTIRERGGLTLNPLQYVDPLMSLVLPVVFLMMGGIALPGGATYIRQDLLRAKWWISVTYAAGPLMNFLIFLGLAAALHPRAGWVDYGEGVSEWTTAQVFVAAMAHLQLLSVILNLIPVPPLDGFGIISPLVPEDLREKLNRPPLSTFLFFAYFLMISQGPVRMAIFRAMAEVTSSVGLSFGDMIDAMRLALWNQVG